MGRRGLIRPGSPQDGDFSRDYAVSARGKLVIAEDDVQQRMLITLYMMNEAHSDPEE